MALLIFKKDFDDFTKSKYVLGSIILMPLLLAMLVPVSTVLPFKGGDSSEDVEEDLGPFEELQLTEDWETLDNNQRLFVILSEMSLLIFMMLPMILPTIIAADSFAGEKDRGTVEGLALAPITNNELYVGKILGAVVPSVVGTWIAAIPFVLIINWVSMDVLGRNYFPNFNFLVLVGIVGPLLGLASANIMVWISTKTSSSRDAQQLGSLMVLPLLLILLGIFGVGFIFSFLLSLLGILILGTVNYFLIKVGSSILDREKWVSRI